MLTSRALAIVLSTVAITTASYLPFAPLYIPDAPAADLINNTYIVMLRDDIPSDAFQAHLGFLRFATGMHPLRQTSREDEHGSTLEHVYDSEIARGYAGQFADPVIEMIRRRPEVRYVEQDRRTYADVEQRNPPWGLARMSHRRKAEAKNYVYAPRGGAGVTVYVLDTGVFIQHPEFQGRATWGKTIRKGWPDRDEGGHGSHCAGTIASRKFGVAKMAKIVAVKVMGGEHSTGTSGDFIAGVEWAAADAARPRAQAIEEFRTTGRTMYKGAVASASIGGPNTQSELDAVNKAVRSGLHMAVSAGNKHGDACNQSPASADLPITVAASTKDDQFASYSNHGKCVDVIAPGSDVLSTGNSMKVLERTKSGTSMAAPHVSGLMAYFLSIYPHPTFHPTFRHLYGKVLDAVFSAIYGTLPESLTPMLPSVFERFEPEVLTPGLATISTRDMKLAILLLSNRNSVRGTPPNTNNLLIFNNATNPKR